MNHIKNSLARINIIDMKKAYDNNTVNSKSKNNNISTVNSKIQEVLENEKTTDEGTAKLLAEGLDDLDSLSYYLILAREHDHAQLLNAMYLTKESANENKIRANKAIYFQGILKKKGMKTKFK